MSYVDALPIGAEVGQYVIESVLGQGGFGIVYRARHPVYGRIALKEFYPKSQASRIADGTIVPSTPRSQEAFTKGVERLMAEGAKLKAFKHRNIVRVIDVFEQNHTAYLVMEEIDGMTLQAAVEGRNLMPSRTMVEDFAAQMIDALKMVHASGLVHRDIAPDNILVDFKSGSARFVLIDFGGAKRVVTDASQSSSRSLTKPGFSSPEQYGSESVGGIKATPATDVYGLAATLHWLISGKTPIDAPNRSIQDTQARLSSSPALVTMYGKPFLSAVDNAMTLRPDGRPQSAEAFQATLRQGVKEEGAFGNWKKPVGVLTVLLLLGAGAYALGPSLEPEEEYPTPKPVTHDAAADATPAADAKPIADAAAAEAGVAADTAPAQPQPPPKTRVCHTVPEPKKECTTTHHTKKECHTETSSDTVSEHGNEAFYGFVPSQQAAEHLCRSQMKSRLAGDLRRDCRPGKMGKVEVECSCDYDPSSPSGASCDYEATAECKTTEEVCENVSIPEETCTTVYVDREVCEWK